jgi:hypothetical protein
MHLAPGAVNLCPRHTKSTVRIFPYIFLGKGLKKTWPTRSGIKLISGSKKGQTTPRTKIDALGVVIVKNTAEGPLRPSRSTNPKLLKSQSRSPLFVRSHYFGHFPKGSGSSLLSHETHFHKLDSFFFLAMRHPNKMPRKPPPRQPDEQPHTHPELTSVSHP